MSDVKVQAVRSAAETVAGWFDRHADDLGAYAARRVGTTVARDVVTETFRSWSSASTTTTTSAAESGAWLYGIATNLIRRHWRTEENAASASKLAPRHRHTNCAHRVR
jgi:RNA polymerase sigma-70 factor (ECF subfamily)